MYLKRLEITGFKSFAYKTEIEFTSSITAIVGPNGSGKSNVAEAFRFVLGEQSFKSMRGKRGEDMIFGGSPSAKRANRASVKLVLDNNKKVFSNIDFDEVIIERVVYRDGENIYSINGSKVRLKDVAEVLSSVYIGTSGHHIISQGEADRILNAKPLERASMIEDSLGLKIYQQKRKESERKLVRSGENLKEVVALRRELKPRIEFLKEQVEKIERAREIQKDLTEKYHNYFKREYLYLNYQKQWKEEERDGPKNKLEKIEQEIIECKEEINKEERVKEKNSRIISLEENISEVQKRKNDLMRESGRLEGEINSLERIIKNEENRSSKDILIPAEEFRLFASEIEEESGKVQNSEDITLVKSIISSIHEKVNSFLYKFQEFGKESSVNEENREELLKLKSNLKKLEEEGGELEEKEKTLHKEYKTLKDEIGKDQSASREAERRMFELMSTQSELRSIVNKAEEDLRRILREEEEFKQEIQEASVLVGSYVLEYKNKEIFNEENTPISPEEVARIPRENQYKIKRDIDRLKIRLEEIGVGSQEEIMNEFNDITERDEFLAKEVADLEHSISSLKEVIDDLEKTIKSKFEEGLKMINEKFQEFFEHMFGGGKAYLKTVKIIPSSSDELSEEEREEESKDGLEVIVSLPRKNINGLIMLSGGERALVSIALIFAVSQVNPPPFLILDETDAALDESNSRKYGDMIRMLSLHSQLVLITHNRETMSNARVLYGITMGSDAVSRMLSVKLEEGEEMVEK